MAFDAQSDAVLLFGGYSNGGPLLQDTWVRNGSTWAVRAPAVSPPALWRPVMSADPSSGGIVLVTSAGTTWTWDGGTWRQRAVRSPSPRVGAAMAADPAHGAVLLFGGFDYASASLLGDTWRWDGSQWEQVLDGNSVTAGPPPVTAAAMAYDANAGAVVLFSGCSTLLGGPDSDGIWLWDGSQWSLHPTSSGPPPRYDASLTADPKSGGGILFGGVEGVDYEGDTWQWSG